MRTRSLGRIRSLRRIRGLCGLAALTTIVALALSSLGCGYALVGRSTNLPEDVRDIFVQALENSTNRAQVDQILTRSITEELVTRQRFRVVSERTDADAILSGTVTSFRVRPVTFVTGGRASEYEILIFARMEFKRTEGDVILWKQDAYQFRETYEIGDSAVGYFDRENLAIEEVAKKFAETLVIDLLEGF